MNFMLSSTRTGIPDPVPLRANTSPVHGRGTLRARAIAEPWGFGGRPGSQDKGRCRCCFQGEFVVARIHM